MTPQVLFLPHPSRPSLGRVVLYVPQGSEASELEVAAGRTGLPTPRETLELRVAAPVGGRVELVTACALAVPLAAALPWLAAVPRDAAPASLRAWSLAARLGLALVAGQHLLPGLAAEGDQALAVWWAVPDDDPPLAAAVQRLVAAMPPAAHALARGEGVEEPAALLTAFLDGVADLLARGEPRHGDRPRARLLPWTARWAEALTDPHDPQVPLGDEAADRIAAVAGWRVREDAAAGRLELAVTAPDDDRRPFELDFALVDDAGVALPAAQVWDDTTRSEALLTGLARAARLFPPLDAALTEARPERMSLTLDQAWRLLVEAAPLLEGAGILLRRPENLEQGAVHGRLVVAAAERPGADAPTPDLRSGAVYAWEAVLADEVLDDAARAELDASGAGLVRWRGHWLLLDSDAQDALARAGGRGVLPLGEALALALQGRAPPPGGDPDGPAYEVRATGAIATLVDRLQQTSGPDAPEEGALTPDGFVGELRPYQRRGVGWLEGMAQLGLGGVLADDMGLGKTVQLIAHLLGRPDDRPSLVVCPTSVVGNWVREIVRFAPQLPVVAHHGAERDLQAQPGGVVVTSYGTLRRDADLLAAIDWDVLTLDEAQQVKNPETVGARAVRRLRARQVVALTGTPLENRLAELWSLLDATNPGLLGSRAGFGRRFAAPIERRGDPEATRRLRRLVAPFVLRRTKAEPEVARDLPPKIERTVTCTLTAEQATLYRSLVESALAEIRAADGIRRRGRILALLTALKQVANHPVHLRPRRAGPSWRAARASSR